MLRTHEDSGIYVHPDYVVGHILPQYIGYPDVTQFDLAAGHAILRIVLSNPTQDKLKQIKYRPLEARMTCLSDILWMTLKFGNDV